MRSSVCRSKRCGVAVLMFVLSVDAAAQSKDSPASDCSTQAEPAAATVSETTSGSDSNCGPWQKLWGRAAPTAIYPGMWTLHLRQSATRLENSRFYGASFRGVVAGTFITSYGDRAWTAALERDWHEAGGTNFKLRFGYRLGLLHGYDEELMKLAGKTPILPVGEGVVNLSVKGLGVQLAYAGIVATVGGFLSF